MRPPTRSLSRQPAKPTRADLAAIATASAPYEHDGPYLTVQVAGAPRTKGSLDFLGRGRVKENVIGSKEWRATVAAAAINRIAEHRTYEGPFPLDGALAADVTFTMPKALSAPKLSRSYPITRHAGDLDKLVRNVFDALATAGAIKDDARIVDVHARKVYPGEHPQALEAPGALIFLYRVGGTR